MAGFHTAPLLAAIAAGAALAGPPPADQPPADQPPATIRTAVDLVPVDVNIVDRAGKPVTGLEARDFALTVDGRPRRIVSAQYVPMVREGAAAPTPPYYSSNVAGPAGRLIMLVVDQGNIGAGRGRQVLEAAQRFISSLTPADRIGLTGIPGAGLHVDFTTNHEAVASVLPKLVGQSSGFEGGSRIALAEAIQVNRGDRLTLNQLVARECTAFTLPAEIDACARQLRADAISVYSTARQRSRNSVVALRSLVERLSATPAPKTIVFVSEGLFIDREYSELEWLGPTAARGQIVFYVLQLDKPLLDTARTRETVPGQDASLDQEGLSLLASLTRGAVLRVVGGADPAFTRLAAEISGYYLLGFEAEAGDRDGKPHKIKVDVPGRSGVEIRERAEFAIAPTDRKTDEETLVETLRAPVLSTDIGLELTAYTLRDPSSERLRVLMAAEIDRQSNADETLSLAYVLLDSRGTVVTSRVVSGLDAPIEAGTNRQPFMDSMQTPYTGVHTLKLAVLDGRGRRGSVEHTFRAQLSDAGQVRATDLVIGEVPSSPGDVSPTVAARFTGDKLHGYLELYADEAAMAQAAVAIEVASEEGGNAFASVPARIRPAVHATGRRTAEASVLIGLLPEGDYVARAVINIDGRKAGQVTRPFRVVRGAATTAAAPPEPAAAAAPPAPRAPDPAVPRVGAFDRQSVLAPPVVGYFLERIDFGKGGAAAAKPAVDHARAGRFDAALESLGPADSQRLAAAFIGGLALLARGDLDEAAEKLRESLKIDPEFFAAVFYLGSCYAAGGKDREAVAAWRTSLASGSDAPFIHTLIADALLRLGNKNGAIDTLKEASSRWPDDDQVQLRLGTALASSGRAAEAVAVLDGYLGRNPDDHERRLLLLRTIYDAHAAGHSIKSPAEDRELFARHAAAYAGPQRALVDEWRRIIEK